MEKSSISLSLKLDCLSHYNDWQFKVKLGCKTDVEIQEADETLVRFLFFRQQKNSMAFYQFPKEEHCPEVYDTSLCLHDHGMTKQA